MQRNRKEILRGIPSVELVIQSDPLRPLVGAYYRPLVVAAVRKALEEERVKLLSGEITTASPLEDIGRAARRILDTKMAKSMRRVVNATGVVLHTNIGRAILAPSAADAIGEAARYYTNLEYDLESGRRTTRQIHLERLLEDLTGAEASHVVNNNAGAVLLALNSLADGRQVVVSRGELVEIGGSFRLPEIMTKSGARLVEVGTTNRTTIQDYEKAIGPDTALLLKVHKSNFRMVGFVAEVSLEELVSLGEKASVPVMEDLGSGALIDLSQFGLPPEPVVENRVELGAGVVSFSGDKLLGGPQAGIIVGKKRYVDAIKKNPLGRALRIDKLTATALEATLLEFMDPASVRERIPCIRMITQGEEAIGERAKSLVARLQSLSDVLSFELAGGVSEIGGGALPDVSVPTKIVVVRSKILDENCVERILREGEIPVVARIEKEAVCLDLRTVLPEEEQIVEEALNRVATEARRRG
ncbi:MAG: L-seryl-tRNA(Sec) selenium transferase [Candidatus Eisenbacteria bacterium]